MWRSWESLVALLWHKQKTNLITVVMSDSNICKDKLSYQSGKIKISLSNAQSLRRRELAVENHICCHAIDAMVITETWLKEDDGIWKNT